MTPYSLVDTEGRAGDRQVGDAGPKSAGPKSAGPKSPGRMPPARMSDRVEAAAVRPASQLRRTGHAVVDLLDHARSGLAHAAAADSAGERYATAHLAALRAAAAVLAARAQPARAARSRRGRSRGPRNVWVDLANVAPELGEWAEFFAAGADKRAAAQAGLPRAVTARDADDLLRDAGAFVGLVCTLLGLPYQQPLDGAAVRLAAG